MDDTSESRTTMKSAGVVLAACVAASVSFAPAYAAPEGYSQYHAISVKGGVFHGPGRMPDSPLPQGRLGHIEFKEQLIGETQFFNNGAEPPNIKSEEKMGGPVDGLLSNGRPFNEHIEGGIAEVGRGAMRFLTVVAFDGPNQGREIYRFGPDYNWHISIDMALDPGFPEGLLITKDLHITTGTLWTPRSLQGVQGIPGGNDQAGSLPSGTPTVGRLGDYDLDGFIDGKLIGVANVPLTHIFTPGDPVVQTRDFSSDIPIAPLDAALLVVASALNYQAICKTMAEPAKKEDFSARVHMQANLSNYAEDVAARLETGVRLLEKARVPKTTSWSTRLRALAKASRASTEGAQSDAQPSPGNVDLGRVNALRSVLTDLQPLVQEIATQSTLKPQATG